MPAELPPDPETLDTYVVAEKSLRQWHRWLCMNPDTGRDESHLLTPGSRYGSRALDTAWFAIAAGTVYLEHASYEDAQVAFESALDTYQGLAVNDNPEVAEMIAENWYVIPDCLRDQLGGEDDVRELLR